MANFGGGVFCNSFHILFYLNVYIKFSKRSIETLCTEGLHEALTLKHDSVTDPNN